MRTQSPTITVNLFRRPDGRWVAACPGCGFELAESWHQERAETQAVDRPCPICEGGTAA